MSSTVTLIGNAGQDPDVKYFESGALVVKFNIAVSIGKDQTEWFPLVIWGKVGEIAGNYVRKGTKVCVVGELDTETWTDKNSGVERNKVVLKVNSLELLGSKNKANDSIDEEEDF